MTTPGKPRQSGIPTPGKTGIPTPGRPRSVSSVFQPSQSAEPELMSRALADAIKANDPAQHRVSLTEPQSLSPRSLQSGRRSVAERRNVSRPPERAKTPVIPIPNGRPPSRPSDVFAKNSSRLFEVGDNVRIDSLGLEGALRYMGEIEGKNGSWAGVELSGQFAGKGKNNGSVNGTQYFVCPDNCGVFVAIAKLSPGRSYQASLPRPSSVASSRNGRATPSISGRNTPSLSTSRVPSLSMSNGRITPSFSGRITPSLSNGRITPGITPSTKSTYLSKSTIGSKGEPRKIPEKITPGSRAAKYANMTAKQLSSRKEQAGSPIRQIGELPSSIPSSPSPISRTLSSPSRPPSSPFTTPKPGLSGRVSNIGPSLPSTRGRSSNNTPRGRIPSAVAMPPPASPISMGSRSASLNKLGSEEPTLVNLELQGKVLQDRISLLMTGTGDIPSHRPDSAGSSHSYMTDGHIERLQGRLEALEVENEQLRLEREKIEKEKIEMDGHARNLAEDHDKATEELKRLCQEKDDLSKTHEVTVATLRDLQELHHSCQERTDELGSRLEDKIHEYQRTTQSLADELSARKKVEEENLALTSQVEELGSQVYDLRLAGQETIALYEERLRAADAQRYDLESRIATLEKGVRSQETEPQASRALNHTSAAEIDNETLRDQVLHLQKKITTMEDLIEDSRIASEKDEMALRERMKRLKEKEESMKLELTEGRREVEQMAKAEAHARGRVEEIEEALRESQVALENARAEIESLRAELANIDGLPSRSESEQRDDLRSENVRLQNQNKELLVQIADLTNNLEDHASKSERKVVPDGTLMAGGNPKTFASPTSKHEISTTREEITGLKHIVQELQKEHSAATQKIKLLESENQILRSETQLLQYQAEHIPQQVSLLEKSLDSGPAHDGSEAEGLGGSYDIETMQRLLKEHKLRYEANSEQLHKRLAEMEMKHARTTHDLNKEISELEALVESKIYREDELEQELERVKDKLSRMKKSAKNGDEIGGLRHQTSSASIDSSDIEGRPTSGNVCEICERPGHDIFNCDLLKEDVPAPLSGPRGSKDKFCSDCETWGHTPPDCPYSQDVF